MKEEIKSLSEQLAQGKLQLKLSYMFQLFCMLLVSTDYEIEKLNCQEMKTTWELANDHFIVAQDKLKQEIYRLHQKLERGEAVR